MDSLDLAYRLGVKLALANANQLQAAVQESAGGSSEEAEDNKDFYEDSITRNMKEHNRHASGNHYGDPIELGMGVDSIFMN